jgi:hypothetical protein
VEQAAVATHTFQVFSLQHRHLFRPKKPAL